MNNMTAMMDEPAQRQWPSKEKTYTEARGTALSTLFCTNSHGELFITAHSCSRLNRAEYRAAAGRVMLMHGVNLFQQKESLPSGPYTSTVLMPLIVVDENT